MTRHFSLLETHHLANNSQRGRARGAGACVRGNRGGRNVGLWMMTAVRAWTFATIQAAVNAAGEGGAIEVRGGANAGEYGCGERLTLVGGGANVRNGAGDEFEELCFPRG